MPEGKEGEFAAAVRRELARLRAESPIRLASPEEALGHLNNALWRYHVEVGRPIGERSKGQMVTYLVEMAALCQRAAEDVCGLTTG